MTTPIRIQRQRVKGWKMPNNTVYVGRPTKWGNPYAYGSHHGLARVPALDGSPWEYENRISADGARHDYFHPDGAVTEHHVRYMTRAECVETYRRALLTPTGGLRLTWRDTWLAPVQPLTVDDVRRELAGQNLACWCRLDQPCHADVLLEVANATDAELVAAVKAMSGGAR